MASQVYKTTKKIKEMSPLETFNQFKGIKEYYFQKAKEKGGTLRLFGKEDEICAKIENALKDSEKHLSIQNFIKKESVIFVSNDRIKCYFDIPKTKGNAELFDLLKEVLK